MNALLDQAKVAGTYDDHTEAPAPFEGRGIPEAGKTPARFIGYIELGERETTFKKEVTGKCLKVKLIFELNGKKHRQPDDEGVVHTPLYYEDVFVKKDDRSSFKKLFNSMRAGRDSIKHMAEMLGEGFLIDIVHNTVGEGKEAKTFANIRDTDGSWTVKAPVVYDAVAEETKPVPVPEATHPFRLLLWGNPTQEQWDSIFIDGTRTVKDKDGNETEVSKNWLQAAIVKEALDFEGSALQALIGGLDGLDLVEDEAPEPAKEPATDEPAKPADTPTTTIVKPGTIPASEPELSKKEAEEVDDVLKELGL